MSNEPLSAERAALLEVLNRELPPGEKMHGWRCEHPDRWPEPCDCADTMADLIEAALDAARASRPEPKDATPTIDLLDMECRDGSCRFAVVRHVHNTSQTVVAWEVAARVPVSPPDPEGLRADHDDAGVYGSTIRPYPDQPTPGHTITPECGPICWTTGHHHDPMACDGCRRLADMMHAAGQTLAAEKPRGAITAAILAVEALGADPLLTRAVVALDEYRREHPERDR